jgi:hypothetical protein
MLVGFSLQALRRSEPLFSYLIARASAPALRGRLGAFRRLGAQSRSFLI